LKADPSLADAKITEERNRRIERQKAERTAAEEAKRKDINERLLEEASAPAYEREIEDCKTLIEYFSRGGGKTASTVAPPSLALGGAAESKLPTLELRKIDVGLPEGATALSKKKGGGVEDEWFAGSNSKKGGKKGNKKGGSGKQQQPQDGEEEAPSPTISTQSLQLPLSTLSALLQLEVPAPLSQSDLPATIEALKTKQQWFQENSVRLIPLLPCRRLMPFQRSKPLKTESKPSSSRSPEPPTQFLTSLPPLPLPMGNARPRSPRPLVEPRKKQTPPFLSNPPLLVSRRKWTNLLRMLKSLILLMETRNRCRSTNSNWSKTMRRRNLNLALVGRVTISLGGQ
jgi:hypothetical protein